MRAAHGDQPFEQPGNFANQERLATEKTAGYLAAGALASSSTSASIGPARRSLPGSISTADGVREYRMRPTFAAPDHWRSASC